MKQCESNLLVKEYLSGVVLVSKVGSAVQSSFCRHHHIALEESSELSVSDKNTFAQGITAFRQNAAPSRYFVQATILTLLQCWDAIVPLWSSSAHPFL